MLATKLRRSATVSYIATWIVKAKNKQHFILKICKSVSLKLGNMGIRALENHTKPSKPDDPKTKPEKSMEVRK